MQEKVYIMSDGRAVLKDFDGVDSQTAEAKLRSALAKAEMVDERASFTVVEAYGVRTPYCIL